MRFTVAPPALAKNPPAYTSGKFGPAPSSSYASSAWTAPLVPLPSADHVVPSHIATWLPTAGVVVSNTPPAYSTGAPVAVAPLARARTSAFSWPLAFGNESPQCTVHCAAAVGARGASAQAATSANPEATFV